MWTKRQSKAAYDREEAKRRRTVEKSDGVECEEKTLGNSHSGTNEETEKESELSSGCELSKIEQSIEA